MRSFFGVHKVVDSDDGRFRVLLHGTTVHGAQRMRDDDGNPLTGPARADHVFFDGAAIAQAFNAVREAQRRADPLRGDRARHRRLACQRRPGDTLTYYEIDPDVVRIARDPKLFTFICRNARPKRRSCSATPG